MENGEATDVLCNEEAEQTEQPTESVLPEAPTEPTEQPTEQPKPKAKARGRPPPKQGEETPLRPRLKDKTTCPDCNKQISNHSLHYTHSKVCKGKGKSNIVLEDIKEEEPKTKTVKPIKTTLEPNPVEVVREIRTLDLSEPEMKDVLLKYSKSVQEKKKIEKQKQYKSLLDGK